MIGKRKKERGGKPDYLVAAAIIFLVIFGLAMVASASSNLGKTKFGDSYYYLKHQILYGLSVGTVGFILGAKVYYRRYRRFALIGLLSGIFLTALVFTPLGVVAKGAARWVSIGPITFQPSEILKLLFVIYLAAWLSRSGERQQSLLRGFVPFAVVLVGVSALLLLQPTTSTVVLLLLTALAVYFASGAKLRYIAGFAVAGAVLIAAVVVVTPYRWQRVQSYLNPTNTESAGAFHLNQAKIAIGSGGISGVGFGQSTTKIGYLPEPIGDSVFAIVAEEFGFIGSTALIAVFGILIVRLFILASRMRDSFGQLLLVGFGTLIGLQTFFHIGAISGILPLTGMPLPFISYGSTALAVFMTIGGITVNISRYVSK